MAALKKCYEVLSDNYVDIKKVEVGISVRVEPAGHWDEETPGFWICDYLKCHVELVGNFDYENMVDSNGDLLSESDDAEIYYKKIKKECSAHVKEVDGFLKSVRNSISNPIN